MCTSRAVVMRWAYIYYQKRQCVDRKIFMVSLWYYSKSVDIDMMKFVPVS